jgi:transposase
MLGEERIAKNQRAREPVGNSSAAIITTARCDAITAMGSVLLRWADARHRTVYQGMGVKPPWMISVVQLDLKQRTVTISVSYDKSVPVACPVCRGQASILFEALVISWLKEASISGVAELPHLSRGEVAGIQQRAVTRGLKRKRKQPLKQIGIDETSFQKRHEYVTVILDRSRDVVVEVRDDRKAEILEGWLRDRPAHHLASVESVATDMWDPFVKAVKDCIPEARKKICFDRCRVESSMPPLGNPSCG